MGTPNSHLSIEHVAGKWSLTPVPHLSAPFEWSTDEWKWKGKCCHVDRSHWADMAPFHSLKRKCKIYSELLQIILPHDRTACVACHAFYLTSTYAWVACSVKCWQVRWHASHGVRQFCEFCWCSLIQNIYRD